MKIKPLCKSHGINDPGIIMFSLSSVIKMIKTMLPPPPFTSNQVYKVIVSLGILLSGFFFFYFFLIAKNIYVHVKSYGHDVACLWWKDLNLGI